MWTSRCRSLWTTVVLCSALAALAPSAGAQERHKFTESNAAADTKYTQQHVIDVGDVPGHQVRIYELRFTWPQNAPAYEGVRAVEGWARGQSEYTNGNGRSWGYYMDVMENGDRIFSRYDGTAQSAANPDGSIRRTYHGVRIITGGTGKFRAIRGVVRNSVVFDPASGFNEGKGEGEYWIE